MKSIWKRLTSRLTGHNPSKPEPQRGSSIQPRVGTSVPTLGSSPNAPINPEGVGSKPLNSSLPIGEGELNSKSKPSTDPLDFGSINRNGKIARLPRALRDRINLALYNRYPAKDLAQALNQMPEVKAVMAQSFSSRPLRPQNISEWKQGGYRDWLHHRQILEQQSELAADAKDLSDTANGLPDSLFGMLTLNYAHLMMNRDQETAEEFEKKRKELSLVSQDISRIHRCHINTRRVKVQEARLERDEEKTEEQLHFKFMEWVENPAIRRACILGPMEANRQTRQHLGMPPRPEDSLVEQLTKNDPYFNPPRKNPAKNRPKPTENTGPGTPPVSDKSSSSSGLANVPSASDSTPSPASEKGSESIDQTRRPMASPSPEGSNEGSECRSVCCSDVGQGEGELNLNLNPQNSTLPSTPYENKTASQLISEIEEQHLRKKSGTGVPPASDKSSSSSGQTNVPSACNSQKKPDIREQEVMVGTLASTASAISSVVHSRCRASEADRQVSPATSLNAGKPKTNPPIRPISPIPSNPQPAACPPGTSAWDSFSEKVDVYAGFRPAPAINLRSALGRNPLG